MLKVKTTVGPSKIHGVGLFADEDILSDTEIAKFDNYLDRQSTVWCVQRSMNEIRRQFWLKYAYLEDGYYCLCLDDLRFMNHSEEPNTYQHGQSDFAIRNITKGEELTCDYFAFDEDAERKLGYRATHLHKKS